MEPNHNTQTIQYVLTAPLPAEAIGCKRCGKQPRRNFVLLPCYHVLCDACFADGRLPLQQDADVSLVVCPVCAVAHPSPKLLGVEVKETDLESAIEGAPGQWGHNIEANIAVVGVKGVGKSRLIATLTGCDVPAGSSLRATTSDWASYRTSSESRIAWWDSAGLEGWCAHEVRKLTSSMVAMEKAGTRFDLVVIVLRPSQQVTMPGLREYLDRLQRSKKRFVVVTTAMGSEAHWASVKTEKRRVMQAYGQPTELGAYADIFVGASGKVAMFGCYVEAEKRTTPLGVIPEQGINELLLCILASLPSQRGTNAPAGRSSNVTVTAHEEHQGEVASEPFAKALHGLAGSPVVAGALLVTILLLQVDTHNKLAHASQ